MLINVITCVSFQLPDEAGQANRFEMNIDLKEWSKSLTTTGVVYIHQATSTQTDAQAAHFANIK